MKKMLRGLHGRRIKKTYISALEKYEQPNSFILISSIEVSKFFQEESIKQLRT